MDNGPSVILMILALFAGVTIFVVALRVIRKLKEEKRLADRHNTTSLRMAKVLNASIEEPDADAVTEAGEESPSESVDGGYADDITGEAAFDGPDDDEAADNYFDDEDIAEEQAGEDYAEEYAEDSDEELVVRPAFAGADEDDSGDETRETQAVSLAGVMASDDDDEAGPRQPAGNVSPLRSIHMQPVQPLRTLQIVDDKVDGKQKNAGVSKRRLPETVKMKERKVLMAEDVKVHREIIEMFFEGSGVKFEFAENGRDACDMFEDNPDRYSLILMDIHMPVMDGYEAAAKIRAMDIDWAKQIPIVAMTADVTENDLNKCFEAGMDDHVAKPIDMAILQDRVFEFITRDSE